RPARTAVPRRYHSPRRALSQRLGRWPVTEWFEQWFGEEYLRLYPHRDEQDAADAVALVARITPLAGRRVLDLGCGTGRHAIHLAGHGARVVGLDLSRALLLR